MQRSVRRPWRRYLDELTAHRPALHGYCCRLTGNVWDGEDLVQDTLMRVFSPLGKTDTRLKNPKAYLIFGVASDQSILNPMTAKPTLLIPVLKSNSSCRFSRPGPPP
jgi:RNA polymerase sigma-70 factor (ECF subfamily)